MIRRAPVFFAVLASACSQDPPAKSPTNDAALTEAQRATVTTEAKAIAKRVLDYSNQIDFARALEDYSSSPDARYVENGVLFPSLDALKKEYAELGPTLEVLENVADAYDVLVLGPDAAVVTVPIHLRVKAKGRPELKDHPYVWSVIVQRRGGRWQVVQTHESHVDYEKLVGALTPPAK
jgi:hypothetical protein